MSNTNISYWERVLKAPTPAYEKLFESEKAFLQKYIRSDMKVLDIGCGNGRNIQNILENTKNVIGIDNDPKAIEESKTLFSSIPTVKVFLGEASALPFKEDSFDVAVLLMILPNLDGKKVQVLSEAARVLKPNGSLILSSFSETAFDERKEIYRLIKIPIDRIEGTTFIFDKSVGANISEQFSLMEIEGFAKASGLKITDSEKVGSLAYILRLKKAI